MSRESLVLLLGFAVFFIPQLGLPDTWKVRALSIVGVSLVFLGYLLRRSSYVRTTDKGNGERGTDSFVESKGIQTRENISE